MEIANHEYYVSLEIAKLLKKAGFKWFINSAYRDGVLMHQKNLLCDDYNGKRYENVASYEFFSAPTLDVAQRWLREVKDINIYVCPGFEPLEEQWKMRWQNAAITSNIDNDDMFLSNTEDNFYDTYEQAQEAAIKRTLEIMLEKGE